MAIVPRLRLVLVSLILISVSPGLAARDVGLKAGDVAPDFLGRDVEGKEISLSRYAGKVVVVSFFASWCAPCRQELPLLERLQRVGGDKGLQVIAIDWQEDRQTFRGLVKANASFQLKFVSDSAGGVGHRYGVKAIPHMLLVGRDGKIAFVNVGYGQSLIGKLLPEVNLALAAGAPEVAATSRSDQDGASPSP